MTERTSSAPTEAATDLVTFDEEALVVAMTVVPGLLSRNKMFALFADGRLRAVRRRAQALRTAVRQLASGNAQRVRLEATPKGQVLVYELPQLSYVRRVGITTTEWAVVCFLVHRAKPEALACPDEARALVEATLRKMHVGPDAGVAR